ncbi:hypothetical protein [Erwinia psidii]|uniref:Uncharacterized protein n=1 Tax=Erwinia psidii TaxID=69224 RepID=A0A3N6TUI2_9GAMM|nr:hypothetical protein [Erwinia psidii]MCX8958361.1 hypothetical protein [Erwinia psidii]MCX8965445.1 hypothetical protein [Erwinia psidii]RQM38922.1 hypothetical protein EB241_06960 [Erwinia psidii]
MTEIVLRQCQRALMASGMRRRIAANTALQPVITLLLQVSRVNACGSAGTVALIPLATIV